jgi:hypothetical protein
MNFKDSNTLQIGISFETSPTVIEIGSKHSSAPVPEEQQQQPHEVKLFHDQTRAPRRR